MKIMNIKNAFRAISNRTSFGFVGFHPAFNIDKSALTSGRRSIAAKMVQPRPLRAEMPCAIAIRIFVCKGHHAESKHLQSVLEMWSLDSNQEIYDKYEFLPADFYCLFCLSTAVVYVWLHRKTFDCPKRVAKASEDDKPEQMPWHTHGTRKVLPL